MANVFGILTAIVLAIAGFVAYKNKQAYETEIANTATEKSNLATSQNRFNTAVATVDATISERKETDEESIKLAEEETNQKKANEDLKIQIDGKTAKAEEGKQKLDEIREKTAKIGDLKDLASKMKTIKVELEELSQSISSAEANLANLTAQNNQVETQANTIKERLDHFSSGRSLPTLDTHIRSIYPSWGFVTLADGNRAGVVTNSTLNVMRDGEVIAKLLVTAVESNSASASIVPDSVAPNVTLMVGDQVVANQEAEKAKAN